MGARIIVLVSYRERVTRLMNVNIWIKNPYPFFEIYDRVAIENALRRVYCGNTTYTKYKDLEFVTVNRTNITTARQIATSVRAFHLQAAFKDVECGSFKATESPALEVEVEIRETTDGRPDWAKEGA